ncbi:hypothetical protein [Micromonospora fluostatini]
MTCACWATVESWVSAYRASSGFALARSTFRSSGLPLTSFQ